MTYHKNILELVKDASSAKSQLFNLTTETKNLALKNIAETIEKNKDKIYEANKKDLEIAQTLVDEGKITKATYGRIKLDENKMRDLIQGIYDVMKLEDPSNKVLWARELDSDLILKKVTSPIGLIAVIFEARPDVMAQISSLAIKSGNAVILKGGKETDNTNAVFYELIKDALKNTEGFPEDAVSLVFSHDDIKEILKLDDYIDLIIPRGSNKLVSYIKENTKIPVLGHASGICHIYVDKSAKKDMAYHIILDAKTQYPTACNSVETVLIHKDCPYIASLIEFLVQNSVEVIENPIRYDIEYSDMKLTLRVVNSTEEAIEHINKYGSGHTDSILTEDEIEAEKFMLRVDSAGVFHNASTRFADGFRYGFGAEVGISTNKTIARGPVGLDGLCTYKYKLTGKGHIVADYVNGIKHFNHKDI